MPIVGQVLDVADRRVALEVVDARDPLLALSGLDARHERAEHVAQVADDADVDGNDLADLGGVDVDVDLLRLTGVGADVAGDAIVEAHAERDEEVGLLNRGVDPGLAVHAHHAEVERDATPGKAPMPSSVIATGMPARSASSRTNGIAPESMMP